jgi:hypothetical protein
MSGLAFSEVRYLLATHKQQQESLIWGMHLGTLRAYRYTWRGHAIEGEERWMLYGDRA